MYDQELTRFLQIEYNAIASSMGVHCSNLIDINRRLVSEHLNQEFAMKPSNHVEEMKQFFIKNYELYGNAEAYFVIVRQEQEGNIFELEQIREMVIGSNIKCFYITEKQMKLENFSLTNQQLSFQNKEIAVMYFRHYYNYDHFDEQSKEIIAMADASKTIMIPDPLNLLFSLKPIQHLLYSEELLSVYGIDFP